MNEAYCEYCNLALPVGVDKPTRRVRSFHFASCSARPRRPDPATMEFKFTHLVFGFVQTHRGDRMPKWLTHRENAWFWSDPVLALEVGQHVDSDFWRIERTA
jgi:hypothetical protein